MRKVSLRIKLAGLLIAAMAVPCFAFFAWTMAWHDSHAVTELTEQGRALARQMDSVWKFMSLNQDKLQEIAYDEKRSLPRHPLRHRWHHHRAHLLRGERLLHPLREPQPAQSSERS